MNYMFLTKKKASIHISMNVHGPSTKTEREYMHTRKFAFTEQKNLETRGKAHEAEKQLNKQLTLVFLTLGPTTYSKTPCCLGKETLINSLILRAVTQLTPFCQHQQNVKC